MNVFDEFESRLDGSCTGSLSDLAKRIVEGQRRQYMFYTIRDFAKDNPKSADSGEKEFQRLLEIMCDSFVRVYGNRHPVLFEQTSNYSNGGPIPYCRIVIEDDSISSMKRTFHLLRSHAASKNWQDATVSNG